MPKLWNGSYRNNRQLIYQLALVLSGEESKSDKLRAHLPAKSPYL
jgi:hypothetical protein